MGLMSYQHGNFTFASDTDQPCDTQDFRPHVRLDCHYKHMKHAAHAADAESSQNKRKGKRQLEMKRSRLDWRQLG